MTIEDLLQEVPSYIERRGEVYLFKMKMRNESLFTCGYMEPYNKKTVGRFAGITLKSCLIETRNWLHENRYI